MTTLSKEDIEHIITYYADKDNFVDIEERTKSDAISDCYQPITNQDSTVSKLYNDILQCETLAIAMMGKVSVLKPLFDTYNLMPHKEKHYLSLEQLLRQPGNKHTEFINILVTRLTSILKARGLVDILQNQTLIPKKQTREDATHLVDTLESELIHLFEAYFDKGDSRHDLSKPIIKLMLFKRWMEQPTDSEIYTTRFAQQAQKRKERPEFDINPSEFEALLRDKIMAFHHGGQLKGGGTILVELLAFAFVFMCGILFSRRIQRKKEIYIANKLSSMQEQQGKTLEEKKKDIKILPWYRLFFYQKRKTHKHKAPKLNKESKKR